MAFIAVKGRKKAEVKNQSSTAGPNYSEYPVRIRMSYLLLID